MLPREARKLCGHPFRRLDRRVSASTACRSSSPPLAFRPKISGISCRSDPERLIGSTRSTGALLNHPNIAHVYGLEESDGVQALVMELKRLIRRTDDFLRESRGVGPVAIARLKRLPMCAFWPLPFDLQPLHKRRELLERRQHPAIPVGIGNGCHTIAPGLVVSRFDSAASLSHVFQRAIHVVHIRVNR